MDGVADQLRRFVDRNGYGGLAYDIDARTINLWWKGELDPDVRTTIDNAPSEVTVKVHPANFSRSELGAAINKIAGTKANDGSYEVQTVMEESAKRPTFVYGLCAVVQLGPGANKDEVASTLSRIAGVPVTLCNDVGLPLDAAQ